MTRDLGRNLAIALAAIVVFWGVLLVLRPAFVVDGTIRATNFRHYPWQIGPRFDLRVTTASGSEVRFRGLRGECDAPGGQFSQCRKPELPRSARVRVVVHGFTDPNTCIAPPGSKQVDWRCLRALDWIEAIDVNGKPVTASWANSATVVLIYVLGAVAVFVMALNGWRLRRISLRTAAVSAVIAATCLVGYAYY
jgi:hypothetical protein